MDKENSTSKKKESVMIWVILTIIALFLAIFFLVHTFRRLESHGLFNPSISQNFHRNKISITDIQGWMTFDFLNKSFGLPPDYLKKGLGITDNKYPNITIDRWARNTQEKPSAILDETKKLIQDFRNSIPPEIPAGI